MPYLKGIIIDQSFCEEVYYSTYNYITINYKNLNPLFVNYNQVMHNTKDELNRIEEFIEQKIDHEFLSQKLCHFQQKDRIQISDKVMEMYHKLCCLANYSEN